MPLYNEEKILAKSVDTIVSFLSKGVLPGKYRITLANNASTDRSWAICRELEAAYPPVRALDIGAKGKGHAVRTAWAKSDGDVLVFMDCDLASDLNFLPALVGAVASGEADIAIGNRLGKNSKITSRHPVREFVSRTYNLGTRLILGTPFDDHQCGFKAIHKDAFANLNPRLVERAWLFDTELLAHAVRNGYSVKSIDIVWTEGAESKVRLIQDSLKMFGDIIRLRTRL